jgi:HK97 family phage major capsid protein
MADRKSELQQEVEETTREILSARGRAKAILNRADAEHRELTESEQQSCERLTNSVDRLLEKRDRAEQELNDAIEAEGRQPRPRATSPERPGASAGDGPRTGRVRPASPRAHDMFGAPRDAYRGAFASLGEFGLAVASDSADPRLIRDSAMSEGVGTSGGFLVPEQWAWGVLDAALADEAIRPRALVLPMTVLTLNVPGFDYLDGTSNKRAGLVLTWSGESSTLTEQVGKTRVVGLVAKKGTILVRVPSELQEDAMAFDAALSTAMTAAVQIGLDVAFIQGTGVGQPLGILNSPALITVAKESGQAANTIFVQNLAKMMGKLSPGSYKRAVWLCHPTCVATLLQMTVVVMNVAQTENVGGSTAGLVTQTDGVLRIAGKEVIVTEACSAFSSAGDVILADLSQYAIGLRRDIAIERSRDVYFTTDEIGFRMRLRLDGQPLAASATKLRDGTNTVSPFVALGAR